MLVQALLLLLLKSQCFLIRSYFFLLKYTYANIANHHVSCFNHHCCFFLGPFLLPKTCRPKNKCRRSMGRCASCESGWIPWVNSWTSWCFDRCREIHGESGEITGVYREIYSESRKDVEKMWRRWVMSGWISISQAFSTCTHIIYIRKPPDSFGHWLHCYWLILRTCWIDAFDVRNNSRQNHAGPAQLLGIVKTPAFGSWDPAIFLGPTSSHLILCIYVEFSRNRDTPKSSTLTGFSIINHPFSGVPLYFRKPPNVYLYVYHTMSMLVGVLEHLFFHFSISSVSNHPHWRTHSFSKGCFNHQQVVCVGSCLTGAFFRSGKFGNDPYHDLWMIIPAPPSNPSQQIAADRGSPRPLPTVEKVRGCRKWPAVASYGGVPVVGYPPDIHWPLLDGIFH